MKWYAFGTFRDDVEITPSMMRELIDQGKAEVRNLSRVPLLRILDILDQVARKLVDSSHPVHRRALQEMPLWIGFSPEMVQAGLETLSDILSAEHMKTRIVCDLGDPDYLDRYVYHETFQGYMRAQPRGVIAHVAAGNVFVGAVDSLVQGMVTKNASILKMSGNDPLFPLLFAELLQECDPEGILFRSFALVPFRGGDLPVEAIIKEYCDAIVVYGGKDAVEAYRSGLGLHTKLIEYGPKYSCVFLDGRMLQAETEVEIARKVARDFTMWDQSACSSPHTVYVHGSEEKALHFARTLADCLQQWTRSYPIGRISPDEQVEITKIREVALVHQAAGTGCLFVPDSGKQDWTVVFETQPDFKVSCHFRTAYVKPIADPNAFLAVLEPYGQYLQSVAVLADPTTMFRLAEGLSGIGADRITEVGMMARRKHGSPHDGTRGLSELVRWCSIGKVSRYHDPFDYLPDSERDELTLIRLNDLFQTCRRKSAFWRDRLPPTPLRALEEIRKVPILTPKELQAVAYPYGKGALTASLGHSYTFGSGGTTGMAKFFHRTVPETLYNARALAKGLALSIFDPGDIVANLLFAGNLWASFISYNQALEQVGCHILPVGGMVSPEAIVDMLKLFKVDGIISIPSVVLSIAQYVEQQRIQDVRIRKVVTGGEHLFSEAREYIRTVLGVERFASTGYTTNDTGAIAFQCEYCEGGVHHVIEELHLVEILDPQTSEPVPVGQPGKIIVTNLHRRLMPTIRYDVGDMGRFLPHSCTCGRTLRLMELLGRSDDVLIIGGGNVRLEAVAKAISEVSGLSYHFRIIGRLDDRRDQLVVEVESTAAQPPEECRRLAEILYERLLYHNPFLQEFLKTGGISRPIIHILQPKSLPRNPRTGKIRQVIEERKCS